MVKWFAVNTKPRNEDRAAHNIALGGYDVLSPKLETRKYREGKFIHFIEPMFPGYIFVRFDPIDDFHNIKFARGVKTIVHFGDRIVALDDAVIRFIQARLSEGVGKVERKPLKAGEKVLIKDGPFKGLSGVFEKELDGKERVAILLEGIQFSARMEVDRDLITGND
jgi:transcriptional antiterminator RfaH